MCYYFNDITKIEDFDVDNTLLHEKSYKNILVFNISYKTLICPKPLCIRLNKVDGFITVYDGTRYLALFGPGKYNATYNRIRYVISQKSGIAYAFSHNHAKVKSETCDPLPLETHWLCIMLRYSLSPFLMKVKITIFIKYS